MEVQDQINEYIASHNEPKLSEMKTLHALILEILPEGKLWFDNGKNDEGKTVTNPTIGYGLQTLKYANGKTKAYFQIGLSANKTGISVYILGLEDKTYLAKTFAKELGKASVTGYCIKFNKLTDINTNVLQAAIRYGIEATRENLNY